MEFCSNFTLLPIKVFCCNWVKSSRKSSNFQMHGSLGSPNPTLRFIHGKKETWELVGFPKSLHYCLRRVGTRSQFFWLILFPVARSAGVIQKSACSLNLHSAIFISDMGPEDSGRQEGKLMAVVMHRAANPIRVKQALYTRTSRSHFPPL